MGELRAGGDGMAASPVRLVRDRAARSGAAVFSAITLAIATAGFAATFCVWTVLAFWAPRLSDRLSVDPLVLGPLALMPLLIGAVGRFPVGMLADRYGARVVFPVVALTSALPLVTAAFVDSTAAVLLALLALSVAGTMFAVGVCLVSGFHPYRRRGWALGVFGTGLAGAPAGALVSGKLDHPPDHRIVLLAAACALLAIGVIAALTIPDRRHPPQPSVGQAALAALRSPVVPRFATLYAAAVGTLIAVAVYLPVYLRVQYGIDWDRAVAATAGCVAVGAALRVIGGALADRGSTVWALNTGFGVAAASALVQAFAPPLPVAIVVFVVMATGLGLASGVMLALIGLVPAPGTVGAIAGLVGAAGALGGAVPVLLLTLIYRVDGSFGIGMTIMSACLVAAALMRTDGLTSAERQELSSLREENRALRTWTEASGRVPEAIVMDPDGYGRGVDDMVTE